MISLRVYVSRLWLLVQTLCRDSVSAGLWWEFPAFHVTGYIVAVSMGRAKIRLKNVRISQSWRLRVTGQAQRSDSVANLVQHQGQKCKYLAIACAMEAWAGRCRHEGVLLGQVATPAGRCAPWLRALSAAHKSKVALVNMVTVCLKLSLLRDNVTFAAGPRRLESTAAGIHPSHAFQHASA